MNETRMSSSGGLRSEGMESRGAAWSCRGARAWGEAPSGAGHSSQCDLTLPGSLVYCLGPDRVGKNTLLQRKIFLFKLTSSSSVFMSFATLLLTLSHLRPHDIISVSNLNST